MKKIIGLIIIGLIGFGGFKLVALKKEALFGEKVPQIFPLHVDVVQPKTGMIAPKIALISKLEPSVSIDVSAKFSSFIKKVSFREGDFVKKGDVLIELDTKELETKMEILKQKRDALMLEIKSASLEEEVAHKKHKSTQTLFKAGAISEENLDDSAVLFQKIVTRKASLEKSYKQLEIELWGLQESVEYYKLTSSMDGIVQKLFIEAGDLATPSKPLAQIASHEKVARFTYDKTQNIEKGDKLLIQNISSQVALLLPSAKNFQPEAKSSPFLLNLSNGILLDTFVFKEPIKGTLIPKMALYNEKGIDYVLEYKEKSFSKKGVDVMGHEGDKILITQSLENPIAIGSASRLGSLSFQDNFAINEIAYE